jgi:hypothetical protein
MPEFNPGPQVVALVTGLRAGLDQREVLRITDAAVREGAGSDEEIIYRLAMLVGAFAITTALICEAWDQADGTGVATRVMVELGQVHAEDACPPPR